MSNLVEFFAIILSALGLMTAIYLPLWMISKLGEMSRRLRFSTSAHEDERVRLNEFAIHCDVHVAVARWYLNRKAHQLNGVREVDEYGDITYLFGEAKRKYLKSY